MFEPRERMTTYDLVRPPAPGWTVDALLICTYSASLETLLSLPAAIVTDLPSASGPGFTGAQLAALKRLCDRTLVFCQHGAIHSARNVSPAVIETERVVYEAAAPRGGAFHPKLWVVRYGSPSGRSAMVRVAIVTRNLTPDQSWDLAVLLEGVDGSAPRAPNDLGHFLRCLPDLAVRPPLVAERVAIVNRLAVAVESAKWRLPKGLTRPAFHAIGVEGRGGWRPPAADRVAILSPFLHSPAVGRLVPAGTTALFIVSRRDALDRAWAGVERFGRKLVLSPPGDPRSGEPGGEIHAKAYIWETGRRRGVALGSMNATTPAVEGRNVEFMASFDCTALLGTAGLESLLRGEALGRVIEDHAPDEDAEAPAEPFDDRPAKSALSKLGLRVECRQDAEGWRLWLCADVGIARARLALLSGLSFRPATLDDGDAAPCLQQIAATGRALFPRPLEVSQITGFIVFRAGAGDRRIDLTLNLPVSGISEAARREAVVRAIIPDDRSFMDFVRGLLGDFSSLERPAGEGAVRASDPGAGGDAWGEFGPGILELLVRCAADDPERFRILEEALAQLSSASGSPVVPPAFRKLWTLMLAAREGFG